MNSKLTVVAIILGVISALGYVGQADYEEAVAQEDRYTNMVCEGYWPDYENRNVQCN